MYGTASGIYDNSLHVLAKLKGFKIVSLNINSVLKYMDELHLLISHSSIDILAINESKFDDSILGNEINVIGYNIVRKDRNRSGGGAVLYIRDTISFSERKDLVPESLEMICIEVRWPHRMAYLISTWFWPPNCSNDAFKVLISPKWVIGDSDKAKKVS